MSAPLALTRRAALTGLALAPLPAFAADDPGSTVRELLRRAQRGGSLADAVAAPDAASFFTADLLARLTGVDVDALFPGAGPLAAHEDVGAAPRLLAMRTLRRGRDEARVEATMRARGRGRRPWTTHFILLRENGRWRVDDLWIEGQDGTLRGRARL
jgi:hypothetical protein